MIEKAIPSPTNEIEDRMREIRPLRYFMLLWVGMVYLWSTQWHALVPAVSNEPAGQLVPFLFTLLMVLSAAGHWFSIRLIRYPRVLWIYLFAQGALTVAMSVLVHSFVVSFLLLVTLAGVAVILFGHLAPSAVMTAVYLGMFLLSSAILRRPYDFTFILYYGLPLMGFVAAGCWLFIRQIEARRRSQVLLAELGVSHRQLSEYAEQVEALTLAAERQRMARELHDTLVQGLASLIMQLEAIDSHLERNAPDRARQLTEQAMLRARRALAEARQAIQSLREPPAEEPAADRIQKAVDTFTKSSGIPCALELDRIDPAIPDRAFGQALPIVQEGLANIARHAQASQAQVRCAYQSGRLTLTVQDDGVGFDPQKTVTQSEHFGLLGLQERVRLAGGTLEIVSSPGNGTLLRADLPVRQAEETLA